MAVKKRSPIIGKIDELVRAALRRSVGNLRWRPLTVECTL